jgi:TnpA family transposase
MTGGEGQVVRPDDADTISKSAQLSDAALSLSDKRRVAARSAGRARGRIHEKHGGTRGRIVSDQKGGRYVQTTLDRRSLRTFATAALMVAAGS